MYSVSGLVSSEVTTKDLPDSPSACILTSSSRSSSSSVKPVPETCGKKKEFQLAQQAKLTDLTCDLPAHLLILCLSASIQPVK